MFVDAEGNDATHFIEAIVANIQDWDMKDIRVLRDLILELGRFYYRGEYKTCAEEFVDMADLPSAPIPDDIDTGYPVWSIDLAGNALVATGADSIMSLDEIREARKYRSR